MGMYGWRIFSGPIENLRRHSVDRQMNSESRIVEEVLGGSGMMKLTESLLLTKVLHCISEGSVTMRF